MTKSDTKANIFLFYGEDDFSIRRKIDLWKAEFAKKYSQQAVIFLDGAEFSENDLLSKMQTELSPSLFSAKKLLIIRDGLPKKADQEKLTEFLLNLPGQISKDFFVVFWQTSKPDGRLKFSKQFNSLVNVTEFNLPAGNALNQWIKAAAKTLNATITDDAADLLAQFLGRDLFEEKKMGGKVLFRKEAYDLWQVYSELSKLASNTERIDSSTVKSLVRAKVPDSVFRLSDSLASKNKTKAFEALENYLSTSIGDEKSAFIKIVGLLSEQFRSLLLVSLLESQNLDNGAIAEKLGWSTGRVFILAKHAKNFSQQTLKKLLNNLLLIDYKIKSSDVNPNLLVDLLILET